MPGSPTLRSWIRAHAENRPGVYRLYDAHDRLLYVGKSVRVRTRLLSYFRADPGEKAGELIAEGERADWDYVPDEFGALVREMRLIQGARPKYNVQHKRPRRYAFLKLTLGEAAPRLVAVTRVVEDGSRYFGPFGRVPAVAEVARELAHVVGLRDCPARTPVFWADQLEMFAAARTPRCIRAELGSCPAPCSGVVEAGAYRAAVASARGFLEGHDDAPLRLLDERMAAAAARLEFEYAARLRDRRERLALLEEELALFQGEVESLSFVYRVAGYGGEDRLYLIRSGRVRDELAYPETAADRAGVAERVQSVFRDRDRGPAALSGVDAAEILLVAAWFRGRPAELERTTRAREWLAGAPRSPRSPRPAAAVAHVELPPISSPTAPNHSARGFP